MKYYYRTETNYNGTLCLERCEFKDDDTDICIGSNACAICEHSNGMGEDDVGCWIDCAKRSDRKENKNFDSHVVDIDKE